MDLISFGVNLVAGVIQLPGDIVGVVASSALKSVGISTPYIQPIVDIVKMTTSATVATAGVAWTAYGVAKLSPKALFMIASKNYLLSHVESVGYRIAKKSKAIAISKIEEKDQLIALRHVVEESMAAFKRGVERGLDA